MMLSVDEAAAIILEHLVTLETEQVGLRQAMGRILARDILADRDFPPFDRVTMDGIAIAYEQFDHGRRNFKIEGMAVAGAPTATLVDSENCLEVMTGAPLPKGTDTVIRYEDVEIRDGYALVGIETITNRQNVHFRGLDQRKGNRVIEAGTRITAAEVGVAATVGESMLTVRKKPGFCIISTGDELVPPEQRPEPHQIRMSNSFSVAMTLEQFGGDCDLAHISDDPDRIDRELRSRLGEYDALILTGGVSMGKLDYVPDVLENLGCTKLFHRVAQRPGKPFWFGTSSDRKTVIFALPGNPVSAMAGTARFVIPWIEQVNGQEQPARYAVLSEEVKFKPDLTLFQQSLATQNSTGLLMAKPQFGKGSGDLASLVYANGFVELPQGREVFEAGTICKWWPWTFS